MIHISIFFISYAVIVVGIGKGLSNSYLLSIATRGNRILKLRDLQELFPGRAAHKILVDLVRHPDYGNFID